MQLICLATVAAAAGFLGGWPWAVIAALGLGVAKWRDSTATALVMSALALSWLVGFWFVGDRRFFFPYSMQFAALVMCLFVGIRERILAGLGLTAAFLWIRIVQDASQSVLLFEALVAVGILGFAGYFQSVGAGRIVVAILASAFAYMSLAL